MSSKPIILLVATEEKVESIFLNAVVQRELPKLIVAREYLPSENETTPTTEAAFAYT